MRFMSMRPLTAFDTETVKKWIDQQHQSYLRLARLFGATYYGTRIVAGVGSALLPFVVSSQHMAAVAIAIAVAVSVALDSIFQPRDNFQLYSQATDLLAIAEMKVAGEYEKYKEMVDIFMATEKMKLEKLNDIKSILDKIQSTTKPPPPPSADGK